jgi:hypothetical protein
MTLPYQGQRQSSEQNLPEQNRPLTQNGNSTAPHEFVRFSYSSFAAHSLPLLKPRPKVRFDLKRADLDQQHGSERFA